MKLLTFTEVSEQYALKTSTLYSMVHKGQIPHVRIGPRTVRFRADELEAWVQERSRGGAA